VLFFIFLSLQSYGRFSFIIIGKQNIFQLGYELSTVCPMQWFELPNFIRNNLESTFKNNDLCYWVTLVYVTTSKTNLCKDSSNILQGAIYWSYTHAEDNLVCSPKEIKMPQMNINVLHSKSVSLVQLSLPTLVYIACTSFLYASGMNGRLSWTSRTFWTITLFLIVGHCWFQ